MIRLKTDFRTRAFFCTIIICSIGLLSVHAQRNWHQQQITNNGASVLSINLDEEIELHINTTSSNTIKITDEQDGEYKGAVMFTIDSFENEILINDLKSPDFYLPDDKLSAHKVKDNKAYITIPENMRLLIFVKNAFLQVTGTFKKLDLNIESGECIINELKGDIDLVSVYAHIQASLPYHQVTATTKQGVVTNNKKRKRTEFKAHLEGIYGNIRITD